jgi:hypothetical protein
MSLKHRGLTANGAIRHHAAGAHGESRALLVYLRNVKEERDMNFLRAIEILGMAGGVVVAGHVAGASAQSKRVGLALMPVSNAALTAPLRNTYGTVKSLSGRVLTLDVGGRDIAFIIDENTAVLAKATGKTVRRGDIARVGYRELDGAMRAVEVQIGGRNAIASR